MSKKNSKNKSLRKKSKFPNLDKKLNRQNLRQYLDFDYIDKLSDKEKKYLDTFIKNYYTADFRGDNLIKSKKEKRKVYNTNNSRNKDLYNTIFQTGLYVNNADPKDLMEKVQINSEDSLIDMIDIKNENNE